jgi:hypothetical protein
VASKLERFWVKVATISKPSVLARSRSSASEASNSMSLTFGSCTAATMALMGFSLTSFCMRGVSRLGEGG